MQLSEMHGTAKVNTDLRTHENEKVCSRTYLLKNNQQRQFVISSKYQ